jgi:hypothetical protein
MMGSSLRGNPGKKEQVYSWTKDGDFFRLVQVGGKDYCAEEESSGKWIKSRKADLAALSELARFIGSIEGR